MRQVAWTGAGPGHPVGGHLHWLPGVSPVAGQMETWVGWNAWCTALSNAAWTASKSTVWRSRDVNAATTASAFSRRGRSTWRARHNLMTLAH
jgi:hypothetical protein